MSGGSVVSTSPRIPPTAFKRSVDDGLSSWAATPRAELLSLSLSCSTTTSVSSESSGSSCGGKGSEDLKTTVTCFLVCSVGRVVSKEANLLAASALNYAPPRYCDTPLGSGSMHQRQSLLFHSQLHG